MKTLRIQIHHFRRAGIASLHDLEILLVLHDDGECCTNEVSDCTAIPLTTAYSTLRRLADASLVEQHGTRPRPSTWILTQNGRNLLSNHRPRPASAETGENPPPVSHQLDGVVTTGGATDQPTRQP